MDNLHHRDEVAGGVGETARTTVLGIWLAHPVFERDLEIFFPEPFTRSHLDGRDHK